MTRLTDLDKINITNLALNGLSYNEIAKKLNLNHGCVYGLCIRRNISFSKQARKYTANFNIFNLITTEEQAYWLGFIFGDGSVRHSNLRIELSNCDINHLIKFKKFMQANNPILPTRKNCNNISINNVEFVKKLAKYNIIPNKTYLNILTPKIPTNLLSHFYRGILDSDGWLCEHKHKKCKSSYDVGFSSYSYDFLIEIKNWINQQLDNDYGYIIERFRKNNTQRVCQLIFGGNKLFPKVTNLFYKNATIYLDRKYKKYIQYNNTIISTIDKRYK